MMAYGSKAFLFLLLASHTSFQDKLQANSNDQPLRVCGPSVQAPCSTSPKILKSPDPEYTAEAIRAKLEGVVVLSAVVGLEGKTRDIKLVRALGLGLDEKAIEALRQWKFKPGTYQGKPVSTTIRVQVEFHLGVFR